MPLILSLVLGSIGLVLVKTAFTTPPDPREVLRSLFAGGSLFGEFGSGISQQQQDFITSRAESDAAKHPGVDDVRRGTVNRNLS